MSNQTTEQTFEAYIEQILLKHSGWQQGNLAEWNKKTALFPARVIDFIKSSQSHLYAQMEKLHGTELDEKIITTLTIFLPFNRGDNPGVSLRPPACCLL